MNLIKLKIKTEQDIVTVRQKARSIAAMLNFDSRDQTAISTSVSELARNCVVYAGGGEVRFEIEINNTPQLFRIIISDSGPGIENTEKIMSGNYVSSTGMGIGLTGSRRLMDLFDLTTESGKGTTITLGKYLPYNVKKVTTADISAISDKLYKQSTQNVYSELVNQNQELINALDEVKRRTEELEILNTELEETNRGVVALYAELDDRAEHLKTINEIKAKFFSNMSHEFKTPLNSILALSRILLEGMDGNLNKEQSKQINFIKKSAEDLFDLVNDLLDLAKVEAGKLDLKPSVFSIKDTFAALRGIMRPLLVNPNLSLIFVNVDSIPPIFTDEGKVSQVLRNFISNAIKFTETGEIIVKAEYSSAESKITFTVSDTGIGIDEQFQGYIFEEFTQIDSELQRKYKGTGLGLSLSKKLATLLGGEVWLKSSLGKGSEFSFSIPANVVQKELDKQTESATSSEGDEFYPILVYTENSEYVKEYQNLLEGSRYNPYFVQDFKNAMEYLNLVSPYAIIFNGDFPDPVFINKYKTFREKIGSETPFIISSYERENYRSAIRRYGYWVKPLSSEKLLYHLDRFRNSKKKYYLIIDDDEISRYLVREILPKDVPVLEAESGELGVKLAKENYPSLIFLDLNMPGINGFEVLTKLRNDPETAMIPVVINTSKDLDEKDAETLLETADAILSKKVVSEDNAPTLLYDLLLRINAFN